MFRFVGTGASLLALFFMLGGHWFALQSVAWARMVARFSRTDSFREAVGKTFDGRHPCKMCLGIREGRNQEQREERRLPLVKMEKLPEFYCDFRGPQAPLPPGDERPAAGFVPALHADFEETPPVPPPRCHLAVS